MRLRWQRFGLAFLLLAPWARASDGIKTAGDVLQYALPVSAFTIVLFNKDKEGGFQFVEAGAVALATTYTLQYTVEETRPSGGGESFPSAHAAISFWSAEFLRKRYGWEYGVPAYAAATFVGYSRVESHEHFTHDVIAGAAIGIISSYIFTKPHHGWDVQAFDEHGKYGMRLARSW